MSSSPLTSLPRSHETCQAEAPHSADRAGSALDRVCVLWLGVRARGEARGGRGWRSTGFARDARGLGRTLGVNASLSCSLSLSFTSHTACERPPASAALSVCALAET
eukprot:2327151-Prymnesium_polylepis.1